MLRGFITYTIERGDTLQRIASKYKLESWQEIAILNNLSYPFIIDETENIENLDSRVKRIGDTVLIPAEYDSVPEELDNKSLEIGAYGCDLDVITEIHEDSNIVYLENKVELKAGDDGDLSIVQGVPNLKQAILLRFLTPLGSNPLHPDYGSRFYEFVGKKRTHRNMEKAKLEAEITIRSDFRVEDVVNLDVIAIDNGIKLVCDIIPIKPFSAFRLMHDFTTN